MTVLNGDNGWATQVNSIEFQVGDSAESVKNKLLVRPVADYKVRTCSLMFLNIHKEDVSWIWKALTALLAVAVLPSLPLLSPWLVASVSVVYELVPVMGPDDK